MSRNELVPDRDLLDAVDWAVRADDRVLVRGASGWFGRTTLSLLWHVRGSSWVDEHVMASASHSRLIDILGCGTFAVDEVSRCEVADFGPNLIVNCAFPTRDRVEAMGLERYLDTAGRLIDDLMELVALATVDRVVTFSSGAAVPSARFPADATVNPYGVLKAREEAALLESAALHEFHAQVCRVWAVSGPHVQQPENYALSDFVLQGLREDRIHIRANRPVIRAYISAAEAVTVALGASTRGSGTVETGGQPIEVGELAALVGEILRVPVGRPAYDPEAPADIYMSNSPEWAIMRAELGLPEMSIERQVYETAEGLRHWR